MGGYSQQSVNDNGGVVWAKQVAQSMDPGAIDSQIQSYKSAASSLASVQTTLQNVKNNLASSWSGDAADQAQQSFQGSINHTQLVQDTISQSVIPPLQSAKEAQTQYLNSMSQVPDEKSVPSNSFMDDVGSMFGVETPAQKAQAHNLAARTQTAEALNTLSTNYESSANQLTSVGSGHEGTVTTTNSNGSFELGSVASSSGNGTASSYSQSVGGGGGGGASAGGENFGGVPSGTIDPGGSPKTTLAGTTGGLITDPSWNQVSTTPSPTPTQIFEPGPIANNLNPTEGGSGGKYNTRGLITDEPEGGNTLGGENSLGEEGLKGGKVRSSGGGVFDETGDGELTGGTGSGTRGRMSSSDGSALSEGEGSGVGGLTEGEGSESGAGGSTGRGGARGGGSSEEDLGSSKYTRGRYLGATDEGERTSKSPVRSVYEDATDADGNKVNMTGAGRRGTAPAEDEEDERSKRPSYLKEDEFWNNAQRIVPPVIQ
jgi:uncharacterized protein YukE